MAEGTAEIVRFVVEAVPKYPVPETLNAVEEAKVRTDDEAASDRAEPVKCMRVVVAEVT